MNVLNPDDMSPITNVVTDANGAFSFQATSERDHLLRIDLGDGHMATWLVETAHLPEPPETDTMTQPCAPTKNGDILLLRRQVHMLQEQLETYEERIRLHDVLGGIGYILGLAGISFYFMGKKGNRP